MPKAKPVKTMTARDKLASLRCLRDKRLVFDRRGHLFRRIPDDGSKTYIVKVTPEEQSFLTAIYTDPRDTTSILVYADWLEDKGGVSATAAQDIRHRLALAARDAEVRAASLAREPKAGTVTHHRWELRKLWSLAKRTTTQKRRVKELNRLIRERYNERYNERDEDDYDNDEQDTVERVYRGSTLATRRRWRRKQETRAKQEVSKLFE